MSTSKASLYDAWLALGEGVRAEIVEDRVVVLPRPTPGHANIERALCAWIGKPYDDDHGHGGPGGWWLFPEVDVRFASGSLVVPDVAGWHRERLRVPDVRPIDVVPDWVCEIVSPSNERHDRVWKAALYAEHGVRHYWMIEPTARVLEAYRLGDDGLWVRVGAWDETAVARVEPFAAVELPVGRLFLPRAGESGGGESATGGGGEVATGGAGEGATTGEAG